MSQLVLGGISFTPYCPRVHLTSTNWAMMPHQEAPFYKKKRSGEPTEGYYFILAPDRQTQSSSLALLEGASTPPRAKNLAD